MIWRLLRKNISVGQILGYAVANLIGLAIVLSAIRLYGDVAPLFDDDDDSTDSLISEDYLVLSKPVSMLNTFGAGSTEFSQSEIDDIASQPWASGVGEFQSADFNVAAAVELGGRGMQTFMFLESIPDDFIDIRPDGWDFDPDKGALNDIPIILSKDYLALYNFGFAASRGLPQLSEGVISQVPIILQMSGNGRVERYQAHIVGFSSRLNTIAVPEKFLTWANSRYATSKASQPSRLIVKVNKPGDPEINKYVDSNGYEVSGDKLDTGRASYFLTLMTSIVIIVGVIISALALFILMLSIHLLLQKNHDKITNLLLLGYSPAQVSAGYYRLIGAVNAVVLILSLIVMFVASGLWEGSLASLSVKASSPLPAIAAGIVIMAIITAVNFLAIARTVRKAYKS